MRRLLLAAVAALAFPGAAAAHATLVGISPPTQSRLDAPPRAVVLRFDQAVTTTPRAIEVFAADGRKRVRHAVAAGGGRSVRVSLSGLRKGESYTVRWRATSSDGHTGSGVYTFGIGVTPPPPTEAYGSTGPTWTDDAARWAFFVALALLVGTVGLRLLVLREPLPPRLSNRLYGLAAAGGIADTQRRDRGVRDAGRRRAPAPVRRSSLRRPLADRDEDAFRRRLRRDDARATRSSRHSSCSPGSSTGRDSSGRPSRSGSGSRPASRSRAIRASSPTRPSSPASPTGSTSSAAILWVGGLVALATCVWPLAPALRRTAFLGFSRIATVLVAVLVLAGTYLSIERLPVVSDLWSTTYGQALLAKLAIVCVALGWGAVHHFVVRPRLERDDAPTRSAEEPDRREHRRDRRPAASAACWSTHGRRRWNRRRGATRRRI